MALKNLFDMVKADRYTADGREALIKAQKEETEDKVYQIGEISQKTGLQKTANGWVKPKSGKQPGAKKEEPKNVHGAEVDKIYERQLKRIKELKAKGFTDEQIDNDKIIKQTKEDMKNVGKKPESKLAAGSKTDTAKEISEHREAAQYYKRKARSFSETDPSYSTYMKKAEEYENKAKELEGSKPATEEPGPDRDDSPERAAYERELSRQQAQRAADDPRGFGYEEPPMEPAAPRREAVSAGRMMKDLDGNFWSRPEDFKEDITSRGWDVDEMTNEYAVISNEAGSQYEVRFDDHSDDGDLTVRNFKALQIDEDDDDDSLEDAAPSLSEIVDRVYNIGEISEKTGLQKTANGWRPVKKGAAGKTSRANKEEAIRKDLGLTAGEDMSRFSDEQIEKMYAKTQQTPEQQKADFDKSKIGQAVNKGRQEFAAEKTRQKELASKTNAIGLPKESKPALSKTDGKGNKVEIKITESKGGGFYVDKYVNGKKVGINNANTRESAEAKAKSMMEQHMADPDYKAEEKPAAGNNLKWNEMPNGRVWTSKTPGGKPLTVTWNREKNGDVWYGRSDSDIKYKSKEEAMNAPVAKEKKRLTWSPNASVSEKFNDIIKLGAKSEDRTKRPGGYIGPKAQENYIRKALSKRLGATEESIDDLLEGMDDITRKNAFNGFMENYSEDAAPRVLTGDCRIRIRKEKPALTGDTKIRVRK